MPAPPKNLVAALPYRYVVGNRASAYGELGKWEQAAADYAWAAEWKTADPSACYLHALVRVPLGDRDGYRKACALILERFSAQAKVAGAELAVWACVLAADGVTDHAFALLAAPMNIAVATQR